MPLRLCNTLSGKIEEFVPLQDRRVRMYACGPTVYDYGHIGNSGGASHPSDLASGDGGHRTRGTGENGGRDLAEADPDGLAESHILNVCGRIT